MQVSRFGASFVPQFGARPTGLANTHPQFAGSKADAARQRAEEIYNQKVIGKPDSSERSEAVKTVASIEDLADELAQQGR